MSNLFNTFYKKRFDIIRLNNNIFIYNKLK